MTDCAPLLTTASFKGAIHRCPHCQSAGVYAIKRRFWQRLLALPHRFECIDCGRVWLAKQLTIDNAPPSHAAARSVG